MRLLYLTYDGLTDFIGQSQVLPYLIGCARAGHDISVISFEKPEGLARRGWAVKAALDEANIHWLPQRFHRQPPLLAKAWDLQAMRRAAQRAIEAGKPFELIHARSYQAGLVAMEMARRSAIPFLFDMRGFWVDQRRDGGRWRADRPLGAFLYKQWKAREAAMVASAAHIVVLSDAARSEVMRWPSYAGAPISVIPCCADFELFAPPTDEDRAEGRSALGWSNDDAVLAWLGSIGTVYRFDVHCRLFDAIRRRKPNSRMLVIGRDSKGRIIDEARTAGVILDDQDMAVVEAERTDVPRWLGLADGGSVFCTQSYSSLGVSPTKMGEYLACGLPVFGNEGVGDTGAIVHELDAGFTMKDFSNSEIEAAALQFVERLGTDRQSARERARAMFDLDLGVKAYSMLYHSLTPLRLPPEGRS